MVLIAFLNKKNEEIEVIKGDYTFETAYQLTLDYLKAGNIPDAIFGANDITALGVLEAVKEIGLNIPDEVEIIGFDDIKMASWPNYQLTTWSQPLETMVNETIKILLKGDLNTNRRIKIKGNFKFRSTTSN
ncbi:substrate-binding domain-containing protein [Mammaliicoccus lentus]|uniref:substrate-binding domain-containing protein n=1 Tax=Mammaliicoccus lentus TaxID=42858 RepID=UPI003F57CF0B